MEAFVRQRAIAEGGGPSGALVTAPPLDGTGAVAEADGAAAAAGAEAAAVCGGFPGITTTRVPTFTRVKRSVTSSLVRRMQPEDTKVPMVEGWLVPWMR
jgi:hypothetical protein